MKDTGVVRRIDDLGRVVIPKEIRKNLKIREGDSLEIYINGEGLIVLRKHSPLNELSFLAKNYAKSILKQTDKHLIITDTEKVIAASKSLDKLIENKPIGRDIERMLDNNENTSENGSLQITDDYTYEGYFHTEIISCYGDIMGCVILLGEKKLTDDDKTILKIASNFFEEYISS